MTEILKKKATKVAQHSRFESNLHRLGRSNWEGKPTRVTTLEITPLSNKKEIVKKIGGMHYIRFNLNFQIVLV
jgi:hypothetical protein